MVPYTERGLYSGALVRDKALTRPPLAAGWHFYIISVSHTRRQRRLRIPRAEEQIPFSSAHTPSSYYPPRSLHIPRKRTGLIGLLTWRPGL
ncbi:hypothetical protein FKM82_028688 [Ascaphus truei]